ncbi:MAG: hypothetical protein HWD90_05380 [Campylobacteraceae bacterium]|nr:hypothetical protein [Campylobacteraceae bacterium]
MLKKIAFLAFLSIAILNANQNLEQTIEDKYASCEKKYDECITQCEEKNGSFEECSANCETKLYACQAEVEEALDKAIEKEEPTN